EWSVGGLRAGGRSGREEAPGRLARGLAAADAEHALWSGVRKMMGSLDVEIVSCAKQREQMISLKLAGEKGSAIKPAAATGPAPVTTPATAKPEIRPGG